MKYALTTREKVIGLLGAFLFISPNLNLMESFLTYCGIENHDTVRMIALVAFALIDLVIGILFLMGRPSVKTIVILVVFNALYITPLIIGADKKVILQYILFLVPITIIAILVTQDEKIRASFIKFLRYISYGLVVIAVFYILMLYFGTNRNDYGMTVVKNLTYGDIGYMFLPPFIISLYDFVQTRKPLNLISLIILSLAILFAGVRSAIICVGCVIFMLWLILLISRQLKAKYKPALIATVIIIAAFVLGTFIIPSGSRLAVVNININLNKDFDVEDIAPEQRFDRNNDLMVIYTPTGKERKISSIYEQYIIARDTTKLETEEMLNNDVKSGENQVIAVIDEDDRGAVENYSLYFHRGFLWRTALAEWKKNPVFGNGCFYYRTKYNGYYPHNVFLEAMTDYGIVGVVILTLLGLSCVVSAFIYYCKHKDEDDIFLMMLLLFAYFPYYALYTTIYSNTKMTFTVILFLTIWTFNKRNAKDKEAVK